MTRPALVGLAVIAIIAAIGGALLVWTDIGRTKVTITFENRTSSAVDVGIGDHGIGCSDSDTVAANTTTEVKLMLKGQNILCLGATIYRLSVTTAIGTRDCYWEELGADRTIVVTDDGPDCAR